MDFLSWAMHYIISSFSISQKKRFHLEYDSFILKCVLGWNPMTIDDFSYSAPMMK